MQGTSSPGAFFVVLIKNGGSVLFDRVVGMLLVASSLLRALASLRRQSSRSLKHMSNDTLGHIAARLVGLVSSKLLRVMIVRFVVRDQRCVCI